MPTVRVNGALFLYLSLWQVHFHTFRPDPWNMVPVSNWTNGSQVTISEFILTQWDDSPIVLSITCKYVE